MKYWIGVTDNRWFEFLRKKQLDSVNFWHPSTRRPFTKLSEGSPFLFKLKAPNNHVAGGGFFVSYTTLPLSKAWEVFGEGNGAATRAQFAASMRRLSRSDEPDPTIGCSVLTQPFFWDEADWIRFPEWPRQNVRGKYYDAAEGVGKRIWEATQLRLQGGALVAADSRSHDGPRFGAPQLVKPRLGQGAFRAVVLDAYGRRCAITGESTLPVLEAAHIRPYKENGPHEPGNGLLLRADFHKLFDQGLVTVTPELRVLVSDRIKKEWFNGEVYNRLSGKELRSLPENAANRPNPEFLRWHNQRHKFAA